MSSTLDSRDQYQSETREHDMEKIEVGKTYKTNNGSTVLVLSRLDNPVLSDRPFVVQITNQPHDMADQALYMSEDGRLTRFAAKDAPLSIKFPPVVTQKFRRIYTDGLIGNSAPSIDALPVTTDHGDIHGILVFTYHDDKLYNVGFARAQ